MRQVLLFVALLCFSPAWAQRLPFFNLGIESGLPQSQATSLTQDSLGRLWIGTLGGLACYDGAAFTTYSVRDGLPSGTVMSLTAAPDGSVYAGTARGAVRISNGTVHRIQFPSGVGATPMINRMATDARGGAWCLAQGILYRIVQDSAVRTPVGAEPATALLPASDGTLLVAVFKEGVYRIAQGRQPEQLAAAAGPLATGEVVVERLFQRRTGNVLALTNRGLFRMETGGITPIIAGGKPLTTAPLLCVAEAPDGTLWLGTRSGVLHVTDSSARFLRRRDGLSDNLFYDALTDREGHVWLASDGQGLFRFSGAPFETMDEGAGLSGAQVMSIAADARGTLYFGMYDAGLFRYSGRAVSAVPFPDGEVPSITALVTAPDGALWIGTRTSGLWRLHVSRLTQVTGKDGPSPAGSVTALYVHPQTGDFCVGFSGSAAVWNGRRFLPLPAPAAVRDFIAIGVDSVLLATPAGLHLFSAGAVRPFLTRSAPDSVSPQCFALRGEELWLGTSDNGVLCYNLRTGQTVTIGKAAGLRSDFVYNLLPDGTGAVWAGTGAGIHRIRLRYKRLSVAVHHGRGSSAVQVMNSSLTPEPEVRYFGEGYGVAGRESNQKASLRMPDGSLWFGTTAGAVHYTPGAAGADAAVVHRAPVSLLIQSVQVTGADTLDPAWYKRRTGAYRVPQGLRLPYRRRGMTVRFHGVSLGGPEDLLYRYRLEGPEGTPWSAWSPESAVTFSALPLGAHRLRVECGTDGRTAMRSTEYSFEVETPFHKTGLFRLIILAGCIGLGVGIQYAAAWRRRAREAGMEQVRREEQAAVRQRTAEDFHDEVGNTLTRMTVLTSVLQSKVADPEAVRLIEGIRENARRLYSGTRDILWSLKPGADNLYEILLRLRDFGGETFGDTAVRFNFPPPAEAWQRIKLPIDWTRNLMMIFKEALNNALKYADATAVTLRAEVDDAGILSVVLSDNGRGFDRAGIREGHGLGNMHTRARRLGGTLDLQSAPGAGTVLTLRTQIPPSTGRTRAQ